MFVWIQPPLFSLFSKDELPQEKHGVTNVLILSERKLKLKTSNLA